MCMLYIFAPDGLFAINETEIRHCKFQIGNCDAVSLSNCKF